MSNLTADPPRARPALGRLWRAVFQRYFFLVAVSFAALLVAWGSRATWLLQAGLFLVALASLVHALWPKEGIQWFGPLLWYDLARLARQSRTRQLRCLYGLGLLAWLCVLFHRQFPDETWASQ